MTQPHFWRRFIVQLACVVVAWCIAVYVVHAEPRYRVVDGDSVIIEGERVRIYGLDCPELREPGGLVAKIRLDILLHGKPITLKRRGQDRYGRTVAKVFAAGKDVACSMIRSGACTEYVRYSRGEYEDCRVSG